MEQKQNNPTIKQWSFDSLRQFITNENRDNKANIVNDQLIFVDNFEELDIIPESNQMQATIIGCCNNGSCTIKINMKDYTIKKNDLLIIFPEQWTSLVNANNFNCSFMIMKPQLSIQLLEQVQNIFDLFLFVLENPCIHLDDDEFQIIKTYRQVLIEKLEQTNNLFYKNIVNHLLLCLLYEICNISKRFLQHNSKKKSKTRKEEYTEKFFYILSEHFKENRNMQFYADLLHITPKYLSSIIKETTGRYATEWIEEFVISEAKNLLKNTSLSIQEISNKLNFNTQSFFGKYFKEHVSLSPKAYRSCQDK